MTRTRLLVLLWVLGLLTLLGAWAHSLFRKSILRLDHPRAGLRLSVGVVAGSIEVVHASIIGDVDFTLRYLPFDLGESPLPEYNPDYRMGRFHHDYFEVVTPTDTLFRRTIEIPIWSAMILWTLAALPLYWWARRSQRRPPAPSHPAVPPD